VNVNRRKKKSSSPAKKRNPRFRERGGLARGEPLAPSREESEKNATRDRKGKGRPARCTGGKETPLHCPQERIAAFGEGIGFRCTEKQEERIKRTIAAAADRPLTLTFAGSIQRGLGREQTSRGKEKKRCLSGRKRPARGGEKEKQQSLRSSHRGPTRGIGKTVSEERNPNLIVAGKRSALSPLQEKSKAREGGKVGFRKNAFLGRKKGEHLPSLRRGKEKAVPDRYRERARGKESHC